MYSVEPYHKGILIQRGRGIGNFFSSIFRTIIPSVSKAVLRKAPSVLKAVNKSSVGKQLKKSAKRIALDTAANVIESGDIKGSLNKSINESKKEIAKAIKNTPNTKLNKRKIIINNKRNTKRQKYHLLEGIHDRKNIIFGN